METFFCFLGVIGRYRERNRWQIGRGGGGRAEILKKTHHPSQTCIFTLLTISLLWAARASWKEVQEEWSTNQRLYGGLNTSFFVQLEQKIAQRDSILVALIVIRMPSGTKVTHYSLYTVLLCGLPQMALTPLCSLFHATSEFLAHSGCLLDGCEAGLSQSLIHPSRPSAPTLSKWMLTSKRLSVVL